MKRSTEIISGSAIVLFHVALTAWLFCLGKLNNDYSEMSLNCLALAAVLLPAYYADRLLLQKGVPVPVFAAVKAAFVALGIWVFTKSVYLEPWSGFSAVIIGVIYCIGFVVCAYLAWMPANENGVLLRFDALVAMLLIMLVLNELLVLPAAEETIMVCALCLCFMLVASISLRSGHLAGRGRAVQGAPVAGRVMLVAALAAVALLAAVVVACATSGVRSFTGLCLEVINRIISAVKAVLLWLYGLLESFMRWLSQFASDEPMESIGTGQVVGNVDYTPMEDVGSLPGWIVPALIVLAIAVLIFAVFRLRHVKMGRVRTASARVSLQKRESGLKKAIFGLLARIVSAITYRWNCLRWRNTAPGLLAYCEKHVPAKAGRKSDESGEAFLRRLAERDCGLELAGALLELAVLVERAFYSPAPAAVPAELCRKIRRGKFAK